MYEEIADKTTKSRSWHVVFWIDPTKKIDPEYVRYMIACEEICPSTGKTHWQCYVQTFDNVRLSGVMKMFGVKGDQCRAYVARGSAEQNKKYCFKTRDIDEMPNPEEKRFIYGVPSPGQGARSDLTGLKNRLDSGDIKFNDISVIAPQLAMQYRNGWRDMESLRQQRIAESYKPGEMSEKIDLNGTREEMVNYIREHKPYVVKDMWDDYRGETTILTTWDVFYHSAENQQNYMMPIAKPLPSRYMTVYPCWKKVIVWRGN